MEFTEKQKNKLKRLKELVKKHKDKLQEKCVDFKQELEDLSTERSDCLRKREILLERLNSLQEELQNAYKEEHYCKQKLETANDCLPEDRDSNLNSLCLLLGFHISKIQLLENNGVELTLQYRDSCYITYREIAQMYELVEILPQHNNFLAIQEFLLHSQDLRGLLGCLRKFFDFTLERAEIKQDEKQC